MKKILTLSLASCLMLTSCGTFYGGAMGSGTVGGALLGGAIGGLIGGPRGHDIGTIVGGLSGLAAGTSIEVARQKRMQSPQRYEEDEQEVRTSSREFQRNRDRRVLNQQSHYTPISVRNVQLVDQNDDRAFNRNEICTLIFEVRNNSSEVVRNIQLEVVELEDNNHIKNPPLPPIEVMKPKQVLRYTAQIYADNRLKEGTARFAILASIDGGTPLSLVEFTAPTKK
jgi:hypothetical protein